MVVSVGGVDDGAEKRKGRRAYLICCGLKA